MSVLKAIILPPNRLLCSGSQSVGEAYVSYDPSCSSEMHCRDNYTYYRAAGSDPPAGSEPLGRAGAGALARGLAGFCEAASGIWRLQQWEVGIEAVPQIGIAAFGCGLPVFGSHLPRSFANAEGDEVAWEARPASGPVTAGIIPG